MSNTFTTLTPTPTPGMDRLQTSSSPTKTVKDQGVETEFENYLSLASRFSCSEHFLPSSFFLLIEIQNPSLSFQQSIKTKGQALLSLERHYRARQRNGSWRPALWSQDAEGDPEPLTCSSGQEPTSAVGVRVCCCWAALPDRSPGVLSVLPAGARPASPERS